MELSFNFYNFSQDPPRGNSGQEGVLVQRANQMFQQAYLRGQLSRVWAWLRRRPCRLQSLEQQRSRAADACYSGRQEVPLSAIRGSENRAADFDAHFHPLRYGLRPRWVQVALAVLQGRGLPAIELIRAGDCYYVRDGHHRVSVARACQHGAIEARVTTWLAPPRPQPCRQAGEAQVLPKSKVPCT